MKMQISHYDRLDVDLHFISIDVCSFSVFIYFHPLLWTILSINHLFVTLQYIRVFRAGDSSLFSYYDHSWHNLASAPSHHPINTQRPVFQTVPVHRNMKALPLRIPKATDAYFSSTCICLFIYCELSVTKDDMKQWVKIHMNLLCLDPYAAAWVDRHICMTSYKGCKGSNYCTDYKLQTSENRL